MPDTTTVTPRIYVASLSDYDGGKLHGVFIDIDEDTTSDDIWEQIEGMLAASPEFREFPQGGPAEEWAIHDYEGFCGLRLGESEPIDRVLMIAQNIIEHGPAWAAYAEAVGVETADADFEDAYMGKWRNLEDYAREWIESSGLLDEVPESLRYYIDYDAYARDNLTSLIVADTDDYEVYIFTEV